VSKFFINRPIVAMVISLLLVIIGAVTIVQIPVSQFSAIAPPEVQIRATYVGADVQTIEQSVATPIEQPSENAETSAGARQNPADTSTLITGSPYFMACFAQLHRYFACLVAAGDQENEDSDLAILHA
jgi:uncharacterized ParB-like nuclease family protein